MEDRRALLAEVMKLSRRKFTKLVEIGRLTKELGDALSKDDRESTQLILKMRQQELETTNSIQRDIQAFLAAMDVQERVYVKGLLEGNQKPASEEFEEVKIFEFGRQCRSSLEETVQIDKRISQKLAGEDSFYKS